MKTCRKVQGLIAASLYEPLDETDQATLETHLTCCPACAAEHASLQMLVDWVPSEPVAFTGDLRPALHEALCHEEGNKWRGYFRRLSIFTMCSLFVFVGFWAVNSSRTSSDSVSEVANNSVDQILVEARALSQAGDPVAARVLLERGISQEDGNREAAILRLEIADLEFRYLSRYSNAYSLYTSVREQYPAVWAQSSGRVKERFDLLTEAREGDFEALGQIDAARKQGEIGIPALESIMAQYPGRMLAGEALTTMASLVDGDGVGALETLKARCTNPIAIAQLDVRLGEGYWRERHNPERGRALLEGVADGPYEVPAKMARETLARLMPVDR